MRAPRIRVPFSRVAVHTIPSVLIHASDTHSLLRTRNHGVSDDCSLARPPVFAYSRLCRCYLQRPVLVSNESFFLCKESLLIRNKRPPTGNQLLLASGN